MKNKSAQELRSIESIKRIQASRENGKKGGRPKMCDFFQCQNKGTNKWGILHLCDDHVDAMAS